MRVYPRQEVMPMAAIDPRRDPDYPQEQRTPMRAATPAPAKHRSRWVWIVVGLIVLAVIAVIAYMAFYNGGSSYGGSAVGGGGAGGGGGGAGGGGYLVLAFSGDQL